MARNRTKTGGRDFSPGVSGNPKGRPPLPQDLKDARNLNKQEVERLLNKFLYITYSDLCKFMSQKEMDNAPVIEALIAHILREAIDKGDHLRLEFLFQRLIGKVKETVDVNQNVNIHKKLVDVLVALDRKEGDYEGKEDNNEV